MLSTFSVSIPLFHATALSDASYIYRQFTNTCRECTIVTMHAQDQFRVSIREKR